VGHYLKGNQKEARLHARRGEDDRLIRGCLGKVPHSSKKIALGKLRVMQQGRAEDRGAIRVYNCPACRHWHIGGFRTA
jgi:hypothetical protein